MQKDLTDITVVVDRSGSMRSCQSDAEGGINAFLDSQKRLPGRATFTMVQFDHEYEFVHRAIPLPDVPPFKLVPRGYTALLDAVGRAVVETGERLSKTPEADRPGLVAFLIITDGEENASREYKKDKIKEMIKTQQDTYKWQFTFLGANQDAFHEAASMGIKTAGALNFIAARSAQAYGIMSAKLGHMRSTAAVGGDVMYAAAFTDEERAEAVK